MSVDYLLQIFCKIRIGHGREPKLRFECFRNRNGFIEGAARPRRGLNQGNWPMIPLHDHLYTLLDPCQHGMDVAGEFSFCNTDRHLFFEHSGN